MFVYGILLHWALMSHFEVCLLGIFVIVGSCEIFMSFHSLSHSCYAFGVLGIHVRVLWYPMLLGSWLICIKYERWVIFLVGSPDHCLTHHSIISDMTFLYCTIMGWSSSILLSHCLILYPITSFQIIVPYFIYSLHIDTHFWFDTFFTSLICFIDGLTTYPFFCFAINISFGYL